MSKKIKKQIKKSMPWLLIFSLIISSVAVGLVFNLDVKIQKLAQDNNINLDFSFFGARAQTNDTASTTVEVRNAPPQFTLDDVTENPVSTSTSPVNIGGSISFEGTGNDPENNYYYFIVCDSAGVTANAGAEPTCAGDTLCVSASTTDETQATCTYSPVTDPPGETEDWYAYVCDDHATDPLCGDVNRGNGYPGSDGASPFYVNHAPTINLASATIDNQEPGEDFEFTATSTDPDTARGGDTLTTYFCDNGGWTAAGCTGDTFCVATSTSGGTAVATSCPWTSVIPTPHNTYTFYVYVQDQFGLAGTNNGTTSTYTIINSRPTIVGTQVKLQPTSGNNIVLNLKGNTTAITASTTDQVIDKNGCQDIDGATSTIYWSNAAGGWGCTADDDDCYAIANTNCVIQDCAGPSDDRASVTCTTTMAFHAIPTDDSAYASTTIWLAAIFPYDGEGTGSIGSSSPGTEVQTTPALAVEQTLIDYDTLTSGTNTGTNSATTTIEVYGNCPIDSYLYGTHMTQPPSYSIDINMQKHDLLYQFDYTAAGTNATNTPSTNLEDLTVGRPSTGTSLDQIDYVYWGIGIPPAQHSGTYEGVNTFQVTIDENGTW